MIILCIVLVCLLVSAMFSGIEAGVLSVNRVRLQHQARLREKTAMKLNRLLARPERVLVTVLMVTNFMNICAVTLSTREFVRWFGVAGYGVAFIIWLPLYLGVELLPKSVFRRFPYRALAAFSEVLWFADLLLSPVLSLGSAAYNIFFARQERDFKKILIAREDLKYLTLESERAGLLGALTRGIIHKVIDFRAVMARDVMSAVTGFHPIKASASVDELLNISHSSHLFRLPVTSGSGEITGLVNVFEVLLDRKDDGKPVGAYARRIVTVAPDEPAYSVIRKLRAARGHLASVRDKNGATIGIVSLEELIKRLVGVPSS
ncbi:MAG: CNNM domain-containing protein [Chthoniobacteraceae bacterium]